MRILLLLLKTMVLIMMFLLFLGFALKNMDSVVVRYFPGLEWHAPLLLVLAVFFVIGIATGIMASLGIIVRQRREIARLRRQLRGHMSGAAVPAPSA